MIEQPKRRWFRFSLRTLFVVITAFAVYLGWQASIVHERKALIAEGKKTGLWTPAVMPSKVHRLSIRTLMGDRPWPYIIIVPDPSPELLHRLEKAFPEAEFIYLPALD